jgi:hypothetical protein
VANRVRKDPAAVVNYGHDWGPWLGNDVILTSTWTVPAGLTLERESHTDTTTTVVVSGGVANQYYTLVNRIVTSAGYTDERSILVMCLER